MTDAPFELQGSRLMIDLLGPRALRRPGSQHYLSTFPDWAHNQHRRTRRRVRYESHGLTEIPVYQCAHVEDAVPWFSLTTLCWMRAGLIHSDAASSACFFQGKPGFQECRPVKHYAGKESNLVKFSRGLLCKLRVSGIMKPAAPPRSRVCCQSAFQMPISPIL